MESRAALGAGEILRPPVREVKHEMDNCPLILNCLMKLYHDSKP